VDADGPEALTGRVTQTKPLPGSSEHPTADAGRRGAASARTGTVLALGSMLSVQVGAAASVQLLDRLDAAAVVWLRLVWAGLILLVIARPRPSSFRKSSLLACVALGSVTAVMSLLFMESVARLPLGTASALEFLGPLGVAMVRGGGRRTWPVLAGVGVVLLTEPWRGGVDAVGVACALGAALCWAGYILLTQRVGDDVTGIQGLGISMPVAAIVITLVAGPASFAQLTWQLAVLGLGLALLIPVVPFTLELLSLRRLTASAFGTLMSVEPAIAAIVGLIFLGQVPTAWAVLGIACVVAAGIGAERHGARLEPANEAAVVHG
jgi:inner membrane transporter RhtA